MKKLEVDLAKKTMQLENLMQEVNMRVKSIEEELQEDDDGHKSDNMKDSQENFSNRSGQKTKDDDPFNIHDENSVEDDRVNIGDQSIKMLR